jgi:uncharacterized membrane protein YfcA
MSLAGTSVGVILNTAASESLLLILLCCLMIALVVVSFTVALRKIRNPETPTSGEIQQQNAVIEIVEPDMKQHYLLFGLLAVVIACGILANHSGISKGVKWTCFSVSIFICISVGMWFYLSGERKLPVAYPLVGFGAGVASGLFGVGGGMIFAPFLLHMKVDPETAVAVSSTCVLFASASTSMQYLFTGRVAVLIALFLSMFGISSAVAAAYLSRSLIRLTNRPYIVHVIVAGAVTVSAGVTLMDTITTL